MPPNISSFDFIECHVCKGLGSPFYNYKMLGSNPLAENQGGLYTYILRNNIDSRCASLGVAANGIFLVTSREKKYQSYGGSNPSWPYLIVVRIRWIG